MELMQLALSLVVCVSSSLDETNNIINGRYALKEWNYTSFYQLGVLASASLQIESCGAEVGEADL